MTEAIIWLLLIELIGLTALPLAFTLFGRFPERGFTLAKPLGLLVVGFGTWFISMLGVGFTTWLCWVVLVVGMGLLNVWLFLRNGRRLAGEMAGWLRQSQHVGLIIVFQIVFWAAFAYLVNMRSYMPDIRDQEKFGDYAFMLSLSLFDKMPPADPWMSGYPINYYYFSHFQMAMLTRMTGITPPVAFNLTVPLIFALTALGCMGIVLNLVSLARGKMAGWSLPLIFGGLALYMVNLMGNLDSLRQIFFPRAGEAGLRAGNFAFNWWQPSRVISDLFPEAGGGVIVYRWRETINEFPMFSYLLADMHPHVMTLPFAVLCIGFALAIWLTPAEDKFFNFRSPDGFFFLIMTGLATGSLYFLNTWDFPTYTLLVIGAAFARQHRIVENSVSFWRTSLRWLMWAVPLVVISLALYLPFHLTFVSLVGGDSYVPQPIANIPILGTIAKTISFVAWDRTPLMGYLLVFGGFALPLVSFLALKVYPYFRQPYAYLAERDENTPREISSTAYFVTGGGLFLLLLSQVGFHLLKLEPILTVLLGLIASPIIAIGLIMLVIEALPKFRQERSALKLNLVTLGLALALIAQGWYLRFELLGILYTCGVLAALVIWFELKDDSASITPLKLADIFVLGLFLLPVATTFGTEIIIIRDIFMDRMNTLFKFYYQAWLLYGLAAGYAAWRIFAWAWRLQPFAPDEKEEFEEDFEDEFEPILQKVRPVPATQFRLAPATGLAGGSNVMLSAGLQPSSAPYYDEDEEDIVDDPSDDPEAEEAEDYQEARGRLPWWRWLWVAAFGLLLVAGLIYPVFGPYEKSGRYTTRYGLDGSLWLLAGGPTGAGLPQDYNAIQWLNEQVRRDRNFAGVILETTDGDWVDYSRVSTFTGLPTLMGWRGHEDQWRGGNAPARSDTFDCGRLMVKYKLRQPSPDFDPNEPSRQKDEPWCRQQLVDFLYTTPDANVAQQILQETGVRYVYVGLLEQGLSNGRGGIKTYPPEGLKKFAQFMKTIYQQDGVTIYGF